jgi:hypothetical protein
MALSAPGFWLPIPRHCHGGHLGEVTGVTPIPRKQRHPVLFPLMPRMSADRSAYSSLPLPGLSAADCSSLIHQKHLGVRRGGATGVARTPPKQRHLVLLRSTPSRYQGRQMSLYRHRTDLSALDC